MHLTQQSEPNNQLCKYFFDKLISTKHFNFRIKLLN